MVIFASTFPSYVSSAVFPQFQMTVAASGTTFALRFFTLIISCVCLCNAAGWGSGLLGWFASPCSLPTSWIKGVFKAVFAQDRKLAWRVRQGIRRNKGGPGTSRQQTRSRRHQRHTQGLRQEDTAGVFSVDVLYVVVEGVKCEVLLVRVCGAVAMVNAATSRFLPISRR